MNSKQPAGDGNSKKPAKHFEPSKSNPFKKKMTSAGRAKKLRISQKDSLKDIQATLGLDEKMSATETLKIAAARLAGIGAGNPVADFEFAVGVYMKHLTPMVGNALPCDHFWDHFLDLVTQSAPALAKTFAKDFQNQFLWCMAGHIQRLNLEYSQLPTSVQAFEFYGKGKKQIIVARLRNGNYVKLPKSGAFPRLDPYIAFGGCHVCPPFLKSDLDRLKSMPPKKAISLLDSGKFKASVPTVRLATTNTLFNVALPANSDEICRELSILGYMPKKKT